MSPIPWPLIGRRRVPVPPLIAAPVAVDPPPLPPAEPTVRVVTRPTPPPLPVPDEAEHAVMRRVHGWLRREEDVVLPRLAVLSDRTDPWTAAIRMFDNIKETR